MSEDIVKIESVSQLHHLMGYEKPKHPLITILDPSQLAVTKEMIGTTIVSNLFYISLKDGNCGVQYGKNHYNFDEGVLLFNAPQQPITIPKKLNQEIPKVGCFISTTSFIEQTDFSFLNKDPVRVIHSPRVKVTHQFN